MAPGSDWALKVSFRVLAVPHKLGCALPNKWQIKCLRNWRAENVCGGAEVSSPSNDRCISDAEESCVMVKSGI